MQIKHMQHETIIRVYRYTCKKKKGYLANIRRVQRKQEQALQGMLIRLRLVFNNPLIPRLKLRERIHLNIYPHAYTEFIYLGSHSCQQGKVKSFLFTD